MKPITRDSLIAAGIRNLREFGYPNCNAENILTYTVYRMFFVRQLRNNLGQHGKVADTMINELLSDAATADLQDKEKS